jgi:hypothetical protein
LAFAFPILKSFAVKIDNETVRDTSFVRRAIVQRDAGQSDD